MKLLVRVIEGRNIPAMDPNGLCDPYVKLQMGKQKFRTKVVKKCLNPSWCEEFTFKVEDLKEELLVSVLDEDKYLIDDFVGQIKVPVSRVFDSDDKSLGTAWYSLQPKTKKSKNKDCGDILLTICFSQGNSFMELPLVGQASPSRKFSDTTIDSPSRFCSSPLRSASPMRLEGISSSKEEKLHPPTFAGRIAQIFHKNGDLASSPSSSSTDLPELLETAKPEVSESNSEEESSSGSFEEAMKTMESRDQGSEIPSNLPSGIILDQLYLVAPQELNSLLFSPDSNFHRSVTELQGTTDLQIGPWKFENNGESLKRELTYVKGPSRLVKATKGFEEQTYLKADGNAFAVLASVSTPDVPYGSTFKTELLYCITPGPELPSGEQSSRLVVSWRMNFLQSTMMKGMIEGGARGGLKESFEHYINSLSQQLKMVDAKDIASNKEQVLATLQVEPQSDWKLAAQYFANFTMLSTIFLGIYVLVHIWLAAPSMIQGLEFLGLDLPDSIGEVIVCGVLVLQGERVLELISRFMQARTQKATDHGVKAQGEGWLLTVALIEGSNVAAVDSSGHCDPYVVFTCNGKTRTSSIKFQKSDPQWNEIFEFDAMDEPPSMVDVEVFDFDGPFDEPTSLGHAEINFLKNSITDLADVWVPLQGKLAQACQSKLHLRIFLDNTRGSNVVKEYLTKMEKEVGKKIRLRSPQTNSAFQKLFGLPPEEFLINDFTCHLKRKMPLQGRLFLSARIIGFHGDLFGHKTNFYFLWEDIEDIQVVAPTLSSMGSPIVVMTLRPGKGEDARHGAKTRDQEGRLKFHFQSFVSFNVAHRTIMALWKARALSPEQKVLIVQEESETKNLEVVEEEGEAKSIQTEESGSFVGLGDVSMSLVYSSVLSVPTNFFMELFNGSELERKVIERAGCLNYSYSPWELDKADVYQRQTYYKFDKRISRYRGEVTSTQQRSPLSNKNGWLIEEVMTLHGIPLGDYFTLHLRYQVEDIPSRSTGCNVQVLFGLEWLKNSRHQKRMTKNILSNLQDRLRIMFGVIEKEFALGK
ncbi:C2 and GRAM domain-containing protein At1g03370 [Rhododendron vialii]|uniref:C2 and GRAM domain-containing protein At1g03370 n=1 Tax=Rhododendron vialii TaxID=182163 RepID=UPI00265E8E11|nr:C2 and GRAM domain-containing protein At1g03370 [Rhododendron vialii]XP_058196571.1 C2 and GRAM domain-containing protein At1g03370 [Rhododendron vialii]